jgi:hypothetical protein
MDRTMMAMVTLTMFMGSIPLQARAIRMMRPATERMWPEQLAVWVITPLA